MLSESLGIGTDRALSESLTVDFKADITLKPLLKTTSAFANTAGGRIYIGVKEMGGKASEICGFNPPKGDLLTWFSNIFNTHIYPPPAFSIHSIAIENQKTVVIVEVAKSRLAPHAIITRAAGDEQKDRVLWRNDDKCEPAPFYFTERLFELRQKHTQDSEKLSLQNPLILEDALLGISVIPKFPSNLILGQEHLTAIKSLSFDRLELLQGFSQTALVNHRDKSTSPNRFEVSWGQKKESSADQQGKEVECDWMAAAQLWRSGSFVFCSTKPLSDDSRNIIPLDLIAASVIYSLLATEVAYDGKSFGQSVFMRIEIRLSQGMIVQACTRFGKRPHLFPSLVRGDFAIKRLETVQKIATVNTASTKDITEILVDILSDVINSSSRLVPTQEWRHYIEDIIEEIRPMFNPEKDA